MLKQERLPHGDVHEAAVVAPVAREADAARVGRHCRPTPDIKEIVPRG
jgi:hypothetical protein